jgi:UDP-N-acetyl-D-galactosamine dehydrogenase
LGYHPEIILAGRRINDGMGQYIASQFIKGLVKKKIHIEDSNILVMGLTFKENCPDIRNTKVMDIVQELKEYNCTIDIYDPWVDLNDDLMKEEGVSLISNVESGNYDGVIIAVAHDEFKSMGIAKIKSWLKTPHVIYDLKHLFDKSDTDFRL